MKETLTIGIASYEDMKARTMAVARGERRPSKDEPTVWFTSLESLAKNPVGPRSGASGADRRPDGCRRLTLPKRS
jgi:hypothetical protein